jgi:DNA-binding CsgD family transcriptional regulator
VPAANGPAGGSAPTEPAEPNELIERRADLARLQAVFGSGRVALLAGEAGIGKTSVLRALARGHAPLGPVWWGGCDALETPHPLAPLLDMARAQRLRFAAQLEGPRPALFEAVLAELQAAPRPVLVVVEDAHWADDATLDLLKFVGRRIAACPALLVVSYRDDEVSAAHPLRRVIGDLPPGVLLRVPLARLSAAGVEQLAQRLGRRADGVHALTRGNAFFTTELLREPAGAAGVPATVQDVVLARFARLPARVRELLTAVALVPGRAERWLVDALLAPTLQDIEAALASGLIEADADALAFRHELGRVAVETSLPPPLAQHWHARLLAVLADPARSTPPARLVHHAVLARDRAAISRHAPLAAAQASERGSQREAHAQWQVALRQGQPADAAEHARWLEAAQAAAATAGASADVVRASQALEALALARGDTAQVALHRSRQLNAHVGMLAHREADAASRAAVAMVEALPPGPEKAFVWANEAFLRMLERDCEAGAQRARQAITMAEALGDAPSLNTARTALGACLLFIDFDAGVAVLNEMLHSRRAAGNVRGVAASLQMLGSGLGELMHVEAAEAHLREAIALAGVHEFDNIRDYSSAWLALCLVARGQWDEAAAVATATLQRTAGKEMSRLMALLALARLRVRRGDPGAAEVLHEALALAAPSGTLQRLGPTHAARAEAAFARGDTAAVRAEVAAALPLAVAKAHPWFIGELAYWAWRAEGAPAGATPPPACAQPYALQISGRWQAAAAAWQALHCPFERARALAEGDANAQREALAMFENLGARPAAEALRRGLREAGVRGVQRGARASTRSHPCGLTSAEMKVLALMVQGLRNAEIAQQLHRSVRTVDHHVAAVLAKLAVDTRLAATRRAEREAWFAGGQSGQGAGAN